MLASAISLRNVAGLAKFVASNTAIIIDVLNRFEAGSDEEVLTTTILNAATEGGGGTWSLSPATPTGLEISTSAEVTINGLKVLGGSELDTGTRGLSIYCGDTGEVIAKYTLDDESSKISVGCAFKINAGFSGANFATWDHVTMYGVSGEYGILQFVDFPGAQFGVRIHTSGGNGSIIELDADTWYWTTLLYDTIGLTAELKVYSLPDLTLVGTSTHEIVNQNCYLVQLGVNGFVDAGLANFIDDFVINLDGSKYPIVPA